MSTTTITISFDKSHLVTIGEKLYGESLELLRELISNAFDADATHVWVNISPDCLIVGDDGTGMDEAGLREFFTIGSQNKKKEPLSPRFKRPRIGQFGIGKFAVLTACERFVVQTQRGEFAGEVVFDKKEWNEGTTWHVPFEQIEADPEQGNGTTVRLEKLKKSFALPDVERFIRERLPLTAENFDVLVNGKKIEPIFIAGRRFPIHVNIPYGQISGELIVPKFPAKQGEEPGIECIVRGVVICRSTFGLELPMIAKLRGQISADFLPITSDRSRFITDAPEYRAFLAVLVKEIRRVQHLSEELHERKEQRKADETLKDTLSRMRKAIRRNPDIAPPLLSSAGDMTTESVRARAEKMAPRAASGEPGVDALNMTITGIADPAGQEHGEGDDGGSEPPARRVRVKNLHGKTVIARSITVGGVGITCSLEQCGKDRPAAFIEAGIVFINTDHALYRKQKEKGQDMLGFYLTYLLSQQVALMLAEGDTRKAFDLQNRLLTDSW